MMVNLKFEIIIRTEGTGIGGEEEWKKMIKDVLNEALVFSHCDEVKFIDLKEITK